jgi:hypothetical protein
MAETIELQGSAAELPWETYAGVTMWGQRAFPEWLYTGTQQAELAEEDANGYPVGTTDLTGVYVETGPGYLGCVLPREEQRGEYGDGCHPAVLTRLADGSWSLEYGLGTDDFLEEGAPMEVFDTMTYVTGELTTNAIAGIDGTEVARAEFVATDGTVVEGTVAAGTLVPGESMFYAEVPGELARVVAYDAAGDVIENHRLRECDTPVECEVR